MIATFFAQPLKIAPGKINASKIVRRKRILKIPFCFFKIRFKTFRFSLTSGMIFFRAIKVDKNTHHDA